MRIRPRLAAPVLIAAALLIAACAPGAVGTRNNPYDLRHDRTVSAQPDATVFVLAAFDPDAFGYTADRFPGRWVPWADGVQAAQITTFFRIVDLVAPEGWRLEVEDVRGYDRARASGIAVEANLRVVVPPGARLGGQRLRAVVEAQNGRRQPIEIVVQVLP